MNRFCDDCGTEDITGVGRCRKNGCNGFTSFRDEEQELLNSFIYAGRDCVWDQFIEIKSDNQRLRDDNAKLRSSIDVKESDLIRVENENQRLKEELEKANRRVKHLGA